MKSIPWRMGALILLSVAVLPLQLRAQEVVQNAGREPVSHTNVISGGPLMLLAGWFNAEYEAKLSETLTAGAVGGWLDMDNTDYTGINAFLRYYPQGAAFTGFYLGGRAGIYNIKQAGQQGDDSETTLGIGMDVGYGWLLGPSDAFFIGVGIGATGLLGVDIPGAKSLIPAVRLLDIGIAF